MEGGKKVSEVCREMGVSAQAFYSWKRKYGGLGLSELRELREENRKLKTLVHRPESSLVFLLCLVGQAILPAAGFLVGFFPLGRLERRLQPRLAAPQFRQ